MRFDRFAAFSAVVLIGCNSEITVQAPSVAVDETRVGDCQSFIVPNLDVASAGERSAMAAAAGSNRRTVYLNFNGGTFRPGADNSSTNTSSIPGSTAQLVPYEEDAAGRSRLLQCVRDQFARYDLNITDQNPGALPHIEAVIGGTSAQVGMGAIGGISPMHGDCSIVERSVVYVFSRNLSGLQNTCEVTAHEISHSLGLEHEYLCEDPMTYLYGCGDKTFQDRAVSCGEYSPRTCMCGQTQNSVQELMGKLGPTKTNEPDPLPTDPIDPTEPTESQNPVVSLGVPADGASLPANTPLEVSVTATDSDGIRDVELLWQFNGLRIFSCNSPPEGFACRKEGDRFTWTLPVGSGARSFSAKATDVAGHASTTEVRSITLTTPPEEIVEPSGPAIAVSAPVSGDPVAPGSTLVIRAEVTGDVGQVWLWWIRADGSSNSYSLAPLSGNTYGLDLQISSTAPAGPRILRTVVYDRAGKQVVAPDVTVEITN